MDIHTGKDIYVLGGGSTSTDLVDNSNLPNAFMILYESDGSIVWGK